MISQKGGKEELYPFLSFSSCDWPTNPCGGGGLGGGGPGRCACEGWGAARAVADHRCCREAGFVSAWGGLEGGLCFRWTSVSSWADQLVVFLLEFIKSEGLREVARPTQGEWVCGSAQSRIWRLKNWQGYFRENGRLGLASTHIFLPGDCGHPAL